MRFVLDSTSANSGHTATLRFTQISATPRTSYVCGRYMKFQTLHLENFINVETQLSGEFISQKDKISYKKL